MMTAAGAPELILQGGLGIERQIREQIRLLILTGQLQPGDELPSIRAVAAELSINPNCVSSAYASLEAAGWLSTAEGSGIFVAPCRPQ
jgi:GntR family transcriptional regulator